MRRLCAVMVLAASTMVPPVVAATPAVATCAQAPAGSPLPADAPDDPVIDRLGLRKAWELTQGAGVTVSVVDSGVDDHHSKLAGAVDTGLREQQPAPPATDVTSVPGGAGEDCAGHGTSIAGLVAARPGDDDRVVGVAPAARIFPVSLGGSIDQASVQELAKAIRDGADNASVENLSFALPSPSRPEIEDAVKYALGRGVVVVAAAGNEQQSRPGSTWYPAAYPGVLAVAAVDAHGVPLPTSNAGPWVGIAAPGESLTCVSTGGSGYVTQSGTSFATALVSGVAALVRARFRSLPAADVVRRLQSTAVPLSGARSDALGAGMVDPLAALTAVDIPATAPPQAGGVAVLPAPAGDTGLAGLTGSALAWAGGLAALAAFAAAFGVAWRRAVRRRWLPGPGPETPEPPPAPFPPDTPLR